MGDAILIICITVLCILCIGEPDILDGLIKLVNEGFNNGKM